jgi:hypothetical protein
MSRRSIVKWSAGGLLLVAAVAMACRDRTPPTGPGALPQGPTPTRLELQAPSSIAPLGSAQLTAILHFSDGTSANVTNEAVWRTDKAHLLVVSPTGLATVKINARGEAYVDVAARGLRSTAEIVIVPDGTYRLTGRVVERGPGQIPIVSAAVETGDVVGLPFVVRIGTELDGRYSLYGVTGAATIRVSKGGYATRIERIDVTDHRSLDFELEAATPRGDVEGHYELTVTASPACSTGLPEFARQRRYGAYIEQSDDRADLLEVTLSGARFLLGLKGHGFVGRLEPSGRMTFGLDAYDPSYPYGYNYPDVVEQVGDSDYLVLYGRITADAEDAGARIDGALRGGIGLWRSDIGFPHSGRLLAECHAEDHRVLMTRVR